MKTQQIRQKPSLRAFTIGELLAVIVIIASLAGFLAPALFSARKAAKASVCLSNLHEIGLAAQMYCSDNDDSYPFAINEIEKTHPFLRSLGRPRDTNVNSFDNHVDELSPYVKSAAVWRCPLDSGRIYPTGASAFPELFLFNGGSSYYLADLLQGQTGTSWSEPSQQAYATDGSTDWHGGPTYLASRRNALFYDWHVALRKNALGPQFMTDQQMQ